MASTQKVSAPQTTKVEAINQQIESTKDRLKKLEAKKRKLARGTQSNLTSPTQVHGVRPPMRHRGKYSTVLTLKSAPAYTAEVMPGGYQGAIAAVNRFKKSGQLDGNYQVVEGPVTLPAASEDGEPVQVPEKFVAVIKLS